MAEVTLEFIGTQLSRLVDGQRQVLDTLTDMKARLQAVETGLATCAVTSSTCTATWCGSIIASTAWRRASAGSSVGSIWSRPDAGRQAGAVRVLPTSSQNAIDMLSRFQARPLRKAAW